MSPYIPSHTHTHPSHTHTHTHTPLTHTHTQMQDVIEKAEEQELLKHYTTIPKQGGSKSARVQGASGYVVSGAPWNAASEEFPAIGSVVAPKKTQWGPSAWGPKLPK